MSHEPEHDEVAFRRRAIRKAPSVVALALLAALITTSFITVITTVPLSTTAHADFQAGMEAYEKGDYDTAKSEWKKSAALGDPSSNFNLGVLYERGVGEPVNYEAAIQYYKIASDLGHPSAPFNLALFYQNGIGTEIDGTKAVHYYRLSANRGIADAQRVLGYLYLQGEIIPQNYAQAVEWYMKAAQNGDAIASFALSEMYFEGNGVPKDMKQSILLATQAADQGVKAAQEYLGWVYFNGHGTETNDVLARKYLSMAVAVENADPHVMAVLGAMLIAGRGGEVDVKRGRTYLTRAGDAGDINAIYNLGVSYVDVEEAYKSVPKAAHFFSIAAEAGHPKAQHNLATMIFFGHGDIPKDKDRAFSLWALAIENGSGSAANRLGQIYAEGHGGVQQDIEKAIEYYQIAISLGHEPARTNLQNLLKDQNT